MTLDPKLLIGIGIAAVAFVVAVGGIWWLLKRIGAASK